jgi:hypothetical protein
VPVAFRGERTTGGRGFCNARHSPSNPRPTHLKYEPRRQGVSQAGSEEAASMENFLIPWRPGRLLRSFTVGTPPGRRSPRRRSLGQDGRDRKAVPPPLHNGTRTRMSGLFGVAAVRVRWRVNGHACVVIAQRSPRVCVRPKPGRINSRPQPRSSLTRVASACFRDGITGLVRHWRGGCDRCRQSTAVCHERSRP